jgi:hypothetical protein
VTSRYTAPLSGYYEFSASVAVCCAGGRMFPTIAASRADQSIRGSDIAATGVTVARGVAGGLMRLQAGDTVELQIYTDPANTLIEQAQAFLSGYLVAAG